MRAYHQSEISHNNNAVIILMSIAAASGAIVLSILFPENPPQNQKYIAVGLFLFVLFFSILICKVTCDKIDSDHSSYERFGKDYTAAMKALNINEMYKLEKDKKLNYFEGIGTGSGYKKTQNILWSLASILIVSTGIFALVICLDLL
ncbi:hypothetical protein [Glycocaulis sp.]|uniref:hypothetical protein n=1 Tax=Glycocaulis sp. TaxID=1969725 RepID=UPI003D1DCEF0